MPGQWRDGDWHRVEAGTGFVAMGKPTSSSVEGSSFARTKSDIFDASSSRMYLTWAGSGLSVAGTRKLRNKQLPRGDLPQGTVPI